MPVKAGARASHAVALIAVLGFATVHGDTLVRLSSLKGKKPPSLSVGSAGRLPEPQSQKVYDLFREQLLFRKDDEVLLETVHQAHPASYTVQVHKRLDHPKQPWTQGLEFTPDFKSLVETSGSYPEGKVSFVRMLDTNTGAGIKEVEDGLKGMFAEGLSALHGQYYTLTYHDKKIVTYDSNLVTKGEHVYPLAEGWGLTRAPKADSLLVTNGTQWLTVLNVPQGHALQQAKEDDGSKTATMTVERTQQITCFGKPVFGINELELVDNFQGQGPTLFGNIMNTRLVMLINPTTGQCSGVMSLATAGLEEIEDQEAGGLHVANGIAYNKNNDRFIVTGKNWKGMYEVSVHPASGEGKALSASTCLQSYLEQASNATAVKEMLKCR